MSDEKEQLERRWRELAELLGVDPSPPPVQHAADAGQSVKHKEERVTRQPTDEPARPRVWEPEPAPATAEVEPEAEEPDPELVEEEGLPEPPPVTSVQDEEPGHAPRSDEDMDDRPRRWRGRRGRRGGGRHPRDDRGPRREGSGESPPRHEPAEAGEPEADTPVHAEHAEHAEESEHELPRRDRRSEQPRLEASEDLELEEIEAEENPEDAGVEQELQETVAEWNVPSWTELIDSLYRPGR